LAHYEVVEKIGVGGMGEVYRATDSKLGRDVALKVLPPALAGNTERLLRFQREAKLLAALNHPNIATLFGVEETDGVHFLVMELVGGEDLSARLKRGPLPVREALKIARSIAEALAAAHKQGIVHRDLKPGNIKLSPDGGVKVLDFGLAKAFAVDPASGELSQSPTITAMGTVQGVILGTAGYMSPEQARGQEIDKRTDTWAFGCVLFEMLTGQQAFPGETVSDTIAKILEREPDWDKLPDETPVVVQRLLRRTMIKDKKRRLQDVADARNEIDEVLGGSDPSNTGVSIADVRAAHSIATTRRKPAGWMLLTALFALVAIAAVAYNFRQQPAPPVTRTSILPAPTTSFVSMGDYAGPVAVSPDGGSIVYVARDEEGGSGIWLRRLADVSPRLLPGTESATFPFWSPDGRSVGFFSSGSLKRIEISGGLPITLCDAPNGRGGTWSEDGVILFSPHFRAPIHRVSASGGTSVAVTELDVTKHSTHRWPHFLPDGKHFVYMAAHHDVSFAEHYAVYISSVDGGETRELIKSNSRAEYASGHLLLVRDNNLLAVPFDPVRGEITGESVPLTDKVSNDPTTWTANFSVSRNGVLAYHSAALNANVNTTIALHDREGNELKIIDDSDAYFNLVLSPDDTQIALSAGSRQVDIWTLDIERGVRTRMTFTSIPTVSPVWSPDGEFLIYSNILAGAADRKSELIRCRASGGDAETIYEEPGIDLWALGWSPDGKYLLFGKGAFVGANESDIYVLPLEGDSAFVPFEFLKTEFVESSASFSPDGRWVAYHSYESGRVEVYVAPFVLPSDAKRGALRGKWQVSANGGWVPRWRGDGKELFFISRDGRVMAADIELRPNRVTVGEAKPLFTVNLWNLGGIGYDVSRDGQRFYINTFAKGGEPPVTLVLNWTSDLKR
jgi:Tol biopolymer transport system component